MNSNKIGAFIKQLREGKNMSQEELANKAMCDRTKINKIENGKRNLQIDDLILFSEIFNVSFEEMITGEFKQPKNEEKIKITLKEYLKAQDTKQKRFKILIIILIIIILVMMTTFMSIYFFQNYSSIRVYEISGKSETYEITDGLLVLSKDKIYFEIGNITPAVETISIYSEINNKKELVYNGSYKEMVHDLYGYDAIISYDDFIRLNQTLYVLINNEEIKLNFSEEFRNNKILYEKRESISVTDEENENIVIPKKIKESFVCDEYQCSLTNEDELITYNGSIFSLSVNNELYEYYIENKILTYKNLSNSNDEYTWKIKNKKGSCISGDCNKALEKYDKFYNNYILKYLQ